MDTGEALRLLNEWWLTGRVKKELAKEFRRDIFTEAIRLVGKYRQAVILTGLRRVGKSTIMYQMIDELLKMGIRAQNIVYFTMDYERPDIVTILDTCQMITGVNWKTEGMYVFLDEIQKLRNWGEQIKMLYDAFPNLHFVLSGSASLQLERMAMDDLVGRHLMIEVPVLSLTEYFSLKRGIDVKNVKLYEGEISLEIDHYTGKPFPELVSIDDQRMINEYLRESVVSRIIGLDLTAEFNDADVNLLNSMVEIFFSEPGMILNVDSLSRTLTRRKQEVERHIYMLEFSKLIRIVKNYRPSKLSESRKLRKVYPYDISLALAYRPSLERGKVLETLMISRLNISRYWREGDKEVDGLVGDGRDIIPVEIKSSENFRDARSLEYLLNKFNLKKGMLIYNGKRVNEGKIAAINVKDVLLYGIKGELGV
ncbi:MAG: ATP-binding protein [Nitrososphaerota archaeon]|nr:ATP-binding protein [Nitrososphaerota archaeon]